MKVEKDCLKVLYKKEDSKYMKSFEKSWILPKGIKESNYGS
jgi:hypothetical protein